MASVASEDSAVSRCAGGYSVEYSMTISLSSDVFLTAFLHQPAQ